MNIKDSTKSQKNSDGPEIVSGSRPRDRGADDGDDGYLREEKIAKTKSSEDAPIVSVERISRGNDVDEEVDNNHIISNIVSATAVAELVDERGGNDVVGIATVVEPVEMKPFHKSKLFWLLIGVILLLVMTVAIVIPVTTRQQKDEVNSTTTTYPPMKSPTMSPLWVSPTTYPPMKSPTMSPLWVSPTAYPPVFVSPITFPPTKSPTMSSSLVSPIFGKSNNISTSKKPNNVTFLESSFS